MITCHFENGNDAELRHVVLGVIIADGKKVLLEKRGMFNGKPLLESGKWSLPGGFLDRDESLIEGIKRETREEIGLEISILELFIIVDNPHRPNDSERQNVNFVFLAKTSSRQNHNNEEVRETKWFDIDNLPPNEKIAFDFADVLSLYKKYLEEKFPLPLIVSKSLL